MEVFLQTLMERIAVSPTGRSSCTQCCRFVLCPDMDSPRAVAHHYLLFYKPYGVLSQFTTEGGMRTLREFGPFPRDVYPAGRLDADSEGLLFLTDDKALIHLLLSPELGHPRTYIVQVERIPTEEALRNLRAGVLVEGKKTKPAEARLLPHSPALPPRPVSIRFRKTVPTAWMEISIHEGRNRQIRRMTAAVGHPTLRLIRTKIGFLSLQGLSPGERRELTRREVARLKKSVLRLASPKEKPRLIRCQGGP
jgi:23S rRNA pseudouridine2457 synthase